MGRLHLGIESMFYFSCGYNSTVFFTCKGMQRFYCIRFQKSRNGKLLPIPEKNWQPFYRDERFPEIESYPESLWHNIVAMKQEVQKAMSRGGQWDGRTISARFFAQPSFFSYLKDELEIAYGKEIPHQAIRFTRSRKVIFDNLSATRRRLKFHGEMI
jgi:hypothetical protein